MSYWHWHVRVGNMDTENEKWRLKSCLWSVMIGINICYVWCYVDELVLGYRESQTYQNYRCHTQIEHVKQFWMHVNTFLFWLRASTHSLDMVTRRTQSKWHAHASLCALFLHGKKNMKSDYRRLCPRSRCRAPHQPCKKQFNVSDCGFVGCYHGWLQIQVLLHIRKAHQPLSLRTEFPQSQRWYHFAARIYLHLRNLSSFV